jgi:bifunctional non-homologous end joining protein LigD
MKAAPSVRRQRPHAPAAGSRRAGGEEMPRHVPPMHAVHAAMPTGAEASLWAYEVKWDGVRAIAYCDRGKLSIESRNLLDITAHYPELYALASALARRRAVIDGEIIALDESDRPSFPLLQRRMHVRNPTPTLIGQVPILFVIFDLLYLDGRMLIERPWQARRDALAELTLAGPSWRMTPASIGDGQALYETVRETGLEGIVAKRLDGRYEPGRRSPLWRKIKLIARQEFVIGGWAPERSGAAGRVGSLLLGYYDCHGRLCYAGSVGTGWNQADQERLAPLLAKLSRTESPFAERVPRAAGELRFVRPSLVAEIEYRRWPAGGLVHQGSFKGLRTDKPASSVVKEM